MDISLLLKVGAVSVLVLFGVVYFVGLYLVMFEKSLVKEANGVKSE